MHLTRLESQILAKAIQDRLDTFGKSELDLPPWDPDHGWPSVGDIYRVEPVPPRMATVVSAARMSAEQLAGMLRQAYDKELDAEWGFVAVNATVLLVKPKGMTPRNN